MRYSEFAIAEYSENKTVYTYEELHTLSPCYIFEAENKDIAGGNSSWDINQSNAFNKGWKKHRKDSRIVAAFEELTSFILSHSTVPGDKAYPPQFKAHRIHANNRSFSPNTFQAHLKGSKIILMFEVIPAKKDNKKHTLNLLHIGTHQEVGQS
jgi:mRNA-degrading endonuclease YafQ of YafQ-DinJ toxin-antitoxin module